MENNGLFQLGIFTLHSGEKASFKIDCDALTESDMECIAWMLNLKLPPFGTVEGIPRGGMRLAVAMEKYITPSSKRILLVDDVYTTGMSMEVARGLRHVTGAVIFARNKPSYWIVPLFSM